jgi:hypothetical protein
MRYTASMLSVLSLIAVACTGSGAEETDARAIPMSQSKAARALRLPVMRPAPSRGARASEQAAVLRVRVLYTGALPKDTTVQARNFNAGCLETFVDSAVARNGNAVVDAIVWIEGAAATLITAPRDDRRPMIVMDGCRLVPRLQVAAPGSTVQLVMRDSLSESFVLVPSSKYAAVDTVVFAFPGQLVPVRSAADSAGVLAVYGAGLPWARAFVAIAPTSGAAVTDADGRAQFALEALGGKAIVRAWHPSMGIVTATVTLTPGTTAHDVTLTFRR